MMVETQRYFSRFFLPIVVASAYLFLYLPIIVLVLFSFNDSIVSFQWTGFSLRWYKKLLEMPDLLNAMRTSFIVAMVTTFLSVTLGTCFVVAGRSWRSSFISNLFYANILLPEIVLGIGLLSIFSFFKIPLGYSSLIAGHTLLALGYVIPIIKARFAELDPVLTEASLDLGATYSQTFYKIILPLLRPSLLASALLVFTLSMDDFLISFFCCGPSVQPLSVYIYSMAKAGVHPVINAISAFFLVLSSLFIMVLCRLKIIDQVISHE